MDAAELIPQYIAAGLAVLPLHSAPGGRCTCRKPDCRVLPDGAVLGSPGKHPLTRHGKDDATTDLGVIAEWAARFPGCNWGGRPPVGAIILDVDPRNGGATTLVALQDQHGRLPRTLTARTGSGGFHIWLSYDGPTRGKLGEGIDIKSNSGYVVLPPSLHASGGRYEWISERPAAYAPQWVRDLLNPPRREFTGTPSGDIAPLVRFVTESVEGERNRRLFWATCRAAEQGVDPAPLIAAAESIGVPAHEARATARSAMNTAGSTPAGRAS